MTEEEWLEVVVTVNKMYIASHMASCQDKHSLNFIINTGHLYREGIESNWFLLNHCQYQLREMEPGHWKDSMMGDFQEMNHQKMFDEHKFYIICSLALLKFFGGFCTSYVNTQLIHQTQV